MALTVYGTPSCGDCKRTMDLLDTHKVAYDYVDLSISPHAMAMIVSKGYQHAPIVITDSDEWSKHNPGKLMQYITGLVLAEA